MGAGSGKLFDQPNEILYHFSAVPVLLMTSQAAQGPSDGASRSTWGSAGWLVAVVVALSLLLVALMLVRARNRSRST
jgi:ABC-type phosphate transport system permease subunit